MSLNGVQLFSCTPDSRLNDWFPYVKAKDVYDQYAFDYANEPLKGAYATGSVDRLTLPHHQDVSPYGWDKTQEKQDKKEGGCQGCKKQKDKVPENVVVPVPKDDQALRSIQQLKITDVQINEQF